VGGDEDLKRVSVVSAREIRKNIREISPIDVYRLLPRTNCRECGEPNCMAFATRVVNGELDIGTCPPLQKEEYKTAHTDLSALMAPMVRAVSIGTGSRAIKIGGKYVLHRHEFTYHNPVPIALDVSDDMPAKDLADRIQAISDFSYNYIGRTLVLDAIAIRSVRNEAAAFAATVKAVATRTDLPLILCSYNPAIMEAGVAKISDRRPLIYTATRNNWKGMADLAIRYECPLTVFAPNDIALLRSLSHTLHDYGVSDLVLDPGTFVDPGNSDTLINFTTIRQAVFGNNDDLLGYPLLGTPITAWLSPEMSKKVVAWKEACIASMLISRHADLLIMHSIDGWVLLPQLIWRFNIYTDPRKPVSVDPGVREFGLPDKHSPVLITTNYALTYFTVESDLKSANITCYLVVLDTGGISVESAVAGRYLTPELIASTLREYHVDKLVSHRHVIIPGLAARISGETEEVSGWHVIVGPKDSSGIAQLIMDHWPPDDA